MVIHEYDSNGLTNLITTISFKFTFMGKVFHSITNWF